LPKKLADLGEDLKGEIHHFLSPHSDQNDAFNMSSESLEKPPEGISRDSLDDFRPAPPGSFLWDRITKHMLKKLLRQNWENALILYRKKEAEEDLVSMAKIVKRLQTELYKYETSTEKEILIKREKSCDKGKLVEKFKLAKNCRLKRKTPKMDEFRKKSEKGKLFKKDKILEPRKTSEKEIKFRNPKSEKQPTLLKSPSWKEENHVFQNFPLSVWTQRSKMEYLDPLLHDYFDSIQKWVSKS